MPTMTMKQKREHERTMDPAYARTMNANYEARLASGQMQRDVAAGIAQTNEDVKDISRIADERRDRMLEIWRAEDNE